MLEFAERLLPLLKQGGRVAAATSIDVVGSSPHTTGTSMAVAGDTILGSVSGGCVEAAALEGCRALLAGAPPSVTRYGFGDTAAAAAGLACGGELDVLLHMLDGECVLRELEAAAAGLPAALAVVTAGPPGLLGSIVAGGVGAGFPGEIREAALEPLGLDLAAVRRAVTGAPGTGPIEVECRAVLRLFVEVGQAAPVFAIIGATDLGRELAAGAAALGYRVLACDPRPAFGTPERMPIARSVDVDLPHRWLARLPLDERSVVVLLTHDEDLDPPAVAVALESPAGYVGALGSRSTAARRARRLRALGVDDAAIARLRSPMGLDLGGSTAAETALSVLAEVLLVRTARSGEPLVVGAGPIHAAR